MKVAYCPYCNNRTLVDDCDWGRTVQCEGPRCEKFFPTAHLAERERQVASALAVTSNSPSEPVAVVLPPVSLPRFNSTSRPFLAPAQFVPPTPLLTAPHHCQVCNGEIAEPIGKHRATIGHRPNFAARPDLKDNCRTDIYAVIYHCPGCLALLETPAKLCGDWTTCPVESCHRRVMVPFDNLLHRHEGDAREGIPFMFQCSACGRNHRCDTLRDGQPTTGVPVVCFGCQHIVLVPASGVKVVAEGSVLDPIQAVQLAPIRRCPTCNALVPADSPCPLCSPVTLPVS